MQDLESTAAKLRSDAELAEQIAKNATEDQKRELFTRLAAHFRDLAGEVEAVIADWSVS